jgi:hypothetical protein
MSGAVEPFGFKSGPAELLAILCAKPASNKTSELLYRWERFDLIRFPYMGQSALFVESVQSLVKMAIRFVPEDNQLSAGQRLCKSLRNLPDLTTHVLDCRTEVSSPEMKFFVLIALGRAKRDVTVSGLPRELKFPDTDFFANTVLPYFLETMPANERKDRLSIGIGGRKDRIPILDEIFADLLARRATSDVLPMETDAFSPSVLALASDYSSETPYVSIRPLRLLCEEWNKRKSNELRRLRSFHPRLFESVLTGHLAPVDCLYQLLM